MGPFTDDITLDIQVTSKINRLSEKVPVLCLQVHSRVPQRLCRFSRTREPRAVASMGSNGLLHLRRDPTKVQQNNILMSDIR